MNGTDKNACADWCLLAPDHDGPCSGSAEAAVVDGTIIIRVPLDALAQIVEGGWAAGGYDTRFRVTDPSVFAKELCHALNDEDEIGTTPIHRLFDECILAAIDQGAEGIEEHPEQED